MPAVLASDTVQNGDGVILSEGRWLDDGTVEFFEGGKLVESRPRTAEESERFAPPAPDPLSVLIADLSKVATLAQVRAAAVKAADLT